MAYGRQDEFLVTVTVDGEKLGTWSKCTGGATSAQDTKFRPGGTEGEVGLGGPRSVENVTVERGYDPARDHSLIKRLRSKVGYARAVAVKQPLDKAGVPYGDPDVFSGTLLKASDPDYDSTSASAAMAVLEISCDGSVG